MSKNERGLSVTETNFYAARLLVLLGLGPAHLALVALGHDVLALVERGPQLVEEGVVAVVEVAEEGLDGLGSLVGVVEGDAAALPLATV